MSGNGSTSSIEEQSTRQDDTSSRSGILHRLGAFLGGLTSRCRRRVDRVRNHRKQRTSVGQTPGNSGDEESKSSTVSTGKQNSGEDENRSVGKETYVDNASYHHKEPGNPQPTLHPKQGNGTPQYKDGQSQGSTDNVSVSLYTGKDNISNIASHSTLPILNDTQASTETHRVLPKDENSKISPRKLSSRISNTIHFANSASTSITRIKNRTSKYSSSQSPGIQELSRNVLKSLLDGNVADDSYRWLADSRHSTVIPFSENSHPQSHEKGIIHSVQQPNTVAQDNSPTWGSSITLKLPDHTQLTNGLKSESTSRVSAWNRIPLRHKRTLNFSRNYVQHGSDDLQKIGVELQTTVQEWCFQNDQSSVESVVKLPFPNGTLDDSQEENFQPLLKLGITEIPQSRNTKSHNILESVNTSQQDRNDFDTGKLATVEQCSKVRSHQKVLSDTSEVEELGTNGDYSSVLIRQRQSVSRNSKNPGTTNPRETTHKQTVTINPQKVGATNGYQPEATNGAPVTAMTKHITTTNNEQPKATKDVQQIETTNSQERETTNGKLQEATYEQIKAENCKQSEITKSQKPEITNIQAATTKHKHRNSEQNNATRTEQLKSTSSHTLDVPDDQQRETGPGGYQQDNVTYGQKTGKVSNQPSVTIYRRQRTGTNKQQSSQEDEQELQTTGSQTLEATRSEKVGIPNGQQPGQANGKRTEEINKNENRVKTKTIRDYDLSEDEMFQTPNSDRMSNCHREVRQLDILGSQTNAEVNTNENEMHRYGKETENYFEYDGNNSKMNLSNMREHKILNNRKLTKAGDDRNKDLRSVVENSAANSVEEVIQEHSVGQSNDQINNGTDIGGNDVNQIMKRRAVIMEGETKTIDVSSRMECNSVQYPQQTAITKFVVNQNDEQNPVTASDEPRTEKLSAAKRQKDDTLTTEGSIESLTSPNNTLDRREEEHELSDEKSRELNKIDPRSNASKTTKQPIQIKDTSIPVNKSIDDALTRKSGINSTAKRVVIDKSFFRKMKNNATSTNMLKNDEKNAGTHSAKLASDDTVVMSVKDQSNEIVECRPVLQNPWMTTSGIINRDNMIGEQQCTRVNVETSGSNKGDNNVETPRKVDPAKPASSNRKNDSSKGECDQRTRETSELEPKCDVDKAAKPSDTKVNQEALLTISIGNSELSESSTDGNVCPSSPILDKQSVESEQVQKPQIHEQTSQMKNLLDSIHDQTTIESDFSDDMSGDAEMPQDVNINKTPFSSTTDSSVTQRKDSPPEETVILLNKRDRLQKPLMNNLINASKENSSKAVTGDDVDGKILSDNCTLRKGEQLSESLPNIQSTAVSNDIENRPRVVIRYKKQPYPPEGRPLSASMGSFRFRKIQGLSGELGKAQSSNDINEEDRDVIKETAYDTDQHNGDHENWTSFQGAGVSSTTGLESTTVNHSEVYSQSVINPKHVSNPRTVSKPASKVAVVVARKIMNKRKTAAPPVLRFNSYKADDDFYIPSAIASHKLSPEVEGLTNSTRKFDNTSDQTEQLYVEADLYGQGDINSGINTVGLSPRELAFAQKLSPGERKTMPSSNDVKVNYPNLVSPNTTQNLSDSRVPNSQGTPVKNSYPTDSIGAGFTYSAIHRKNTLRKRLSGSDASSEFLQKAMSERRVVLPSRFQERSQKVASSSRQVQYGSSSDPRRRQQLENKVYGNTDRNSSMSPFSKSTDSPRIIQASKKIMMKRETLHSTRIMNRKADKSDTCNERPDDEQVVHAYSHQSGDPVYPAIGSRTSGATSADREHDCLWLDDQDTEQNYLNTGMSAELLDSDGINNGLREDLSYLQHILEENESTKNMSGSKASSTFLNTAISERRAIFPSRLRSKANNSTTGIGPPVLASKGSTKGLRSECNLSETSIQDENDSVILTDGSEIKPVGDPFKNTESNEVENMIADSSQKNMTYDNVARFDSSHLQQSQSDVNSVTSEPVVQHIESNTPPEESITPDAKKHIQFPLPKPRETLVPSHFPVNKHRLPTVYKPLRETAPTQVNAPTIPRLATSTSQATAVMEDSVEENEIVKPIIRRPPMESIPTVSKKIKIFRSRQKMVLTGRLHQKSEENLKFFKQISKTTADFYKDRTRNVQ